MRKISFSFFFLFILLGLPAQSEARTRRPPPPPFTALDPEAIELMKGVKGYWVEVQVAQRKLLLAKGDHLIKAFPIAVGEPTYPTPVGERKINTVIWNPWWHPPKGSKWVEDPTPVPPRVPENPLGEIKMPLGDSYLIHGTRAVNSIGGWASHGCIRMIFEDLFGVVQILMTDYSNLSALDMMEKANRDVNEQFTTPLARSIPVVLTYTPVRVRDGFVSISPDLYNRVGDMVEHISETIRPHLAKHQAPSPKKIRNAIKLFKHDTIQFPLASLVVEGDEANDAELKKLEELEKKREEKLKIAEEKRKAREAKKKEGEALKVDREKEPVKDAAEKEEEARIAQLEKELAAKKDKEAEKKAENKKEEATQKTEEKKPKKRR